MPLPVVGPLPAPQRRNHDLVPHNRYVFGLFRAGMANRQSHLRMHGTCDLADGAHDRHVFGGFAVHVKYLVIGVEPRGVGRCVRQETDNLQGARRLAYLDPDTDKLLRHVLLEILHLPRPDKRCVRIETVKRRLGKLRDDHFFGNLQGNAVQRQNLSEYHSELLVRNRSRRCGEFVLDRSDTGQPLFGVVRRNRIVQFLLCPHQHLAQEPAASQPLLGHLVVIHEVDIVSIQRTQRAKHHLGLDPFMTYNAALAATIVLQRYFDQCFFTQIIGIVLVLLVFGIQVDKPVENIRVGVDPSTLGVQFLALLYGCCDNFSNKRVFQNGCLLVFVGILTRPNHHRDDFPDIVGIDDIIRLELLAKFFEFVLLLRKRLFLR